MEKFNVCIWDCNRQMFIPYDVIPYFVKAYKELKKKKSLQKWNPLPVTFEEFKKFIEKESQYQFWGRCEYEIIIVDWPNQKREKKVDVHNQIMMNIDVVTRLVMESIPKPRKKNGSSR